MTIVQVSNKTIIYMVTIFLINGLYLFVLVISQFFFDIDSHADEHCKTCICCTKNPIRAFGRCLSWLPEFAG